MSSKFRRARGEILFDHRESPGLTEKMTHDAGLPRQVAGKGKQFETWTYTCKHCNTPVIINPERKRPREYCSQCDSWICDRCSAVMAITGVCKTFDQILDEVLAAASKGDAEGIARSMEHTTFTMKPFA